MPVIAQEIVFLGIFQTDQSIELTQTCSNCTFVNITSITAPNSTIIIQDVTMTKTDFTYNYTLTAQDLTGTYNVCGVGDLDGVNTVWCYSFELTETGKATSLDNTLYYVIIIIIVMIMSGLLYAGNKIELFFIEYNRKISKDKYELVKVYVDKFFAYIVAAWLMLPLINVAIKINEIYSLGLTNTLDGLYSGAMWILSIISIIAVILILIYLFIKFNDYIMEKMK